MLCYSVSCRRGKVQGVSDDPPGLCRTDLRGGGISALVLQPDRPTWLHEGRDAVVLEEIHRPGVELALWRRTLPPCLDWWLNRCPPDALPDGQVLCRLADLRPAITSLMTPAAPPGPLQDMLLDDIATLASRFAHLSGGDVLDVRLDRVDDNACAAFHRDCVSLRLLATYRGAGTEWIAPANADTALRDQQAYKGTHPVSTAG